MTAPSAPDPIVEAYKKDIDRTLLRANLQLTIEERWRKLASLLHFLQEWRGVARKAGR